MSLTLPLYIVLFLYSTAAVIALLFGMTFSKTRHGEVSRMEGKVTHDRHRDFAEENAENKEIDIDGFDADGNRKYAA